ncbi:MAG: BadF/BadG/BcrA/BcrD ATPase family protein [Gaiellaceae bacterium]
MRFVLGVDGGNTKTIALLVREDGSVAGKGRAGCADPHAAPGSAAAVTEIASAVGQALASAGLAAADVSSAAFSLAGADWEEDFVFLRDSITARAGITSPQVVNDSIGLLRCGSPETVGVAVAVGTGGAIGGRGPTGAVFHLGFWPEPTGGAALARAALRAVYRADLGLAPPTSLANRLCETFGVASARELLYVLNRREASVPIEGKRLPAILLDEADAGDPVSLAIVRENAQSLGRAARITADEVGLRPSDPLVLGGGVLAHRSTLIEDEIAAVGGFDVVVRPQLEPAIGAVLIAFDGLGVEAPVDAVVASLPERSFFATA